MSIDDSLENYKSLQKLYALTEINENCVDIDFGYAFICAMASSELELDQWMPLLFVSGESCFTHERIANDYAQSVLAIYQQMNASFEQGIALPLMLEQSMSTNENAIFNFASGYLQALIMIDNMQMNQFVEGSPEANLQQTCFLLLDKLATIDTDDVQKLALFEQLPQQHEIITVLPSLLGNYGHLCLSVKS